ncbi:MAG: hypothetical protein ABIA12_02790 [Candidatus Aenigmatarchaeota archaeon]
MGSRNRRMAYVGQPRNRATPASSAADGPVPGHGAAAVLGCLVREAGRGAKPVFDVAVELNLAEQDARKAVYELHKEERCVCIGDLAYVTDAGKKFYDSSI